MGVLHPALLAMGVAAVTIPIVIHLLLRQRRKPIPWAAMRFLLEAYRRQRRKLRLQHLLLLAARCLIVLLVGLALARPVLRGTGLVGTGTGRDVYLLIDTALASQLRAPGAAQTALERHVDAARLLLAGLGPGDRAALITLGGPAAGLVVPASPDLGAVGRLLGEIASTDSATDLAGGLERVAAELARNDDRAGEAFIVVLSDFLDGSADTSRPLPASLAQRAGLRVLASTPLAAPNANVQIIGVEPLRPVVLTGGSSERASAQRDQVRVLLRRSGSSVAQEGASAVRLRVVGAEGAGPAGPGAQGVVRWPPGQSEASVSLAIDAPPPAEDSTGGAVLLAEIDRDALSADNTFRRPIAVREALRAGVVARRRFGAPASVDALEPADWLRLALAPTSGSPIAVVDLEPASLDTPSLAGLDVVFLPAPELVPDEAWPLLRRFADAGGLVIVSPAADAQVQLWSDAMVRELGLAWRVAREPVTPAARTTVSDRAGASPILALLSAELESLTRPVGVSRLLPVDVGASGSAVLLSLSDGSPWLVVSEPGAAQSNGSASAGVAASPGPGRGLVAYLASAPTLSWTDLPARPLMVPLVQELARQGYGRSAGGSALVAGALLAAPARTSELRAFDIAPTQPPAPDGAAVLTPDAPARRAGLWRAIDENGRARGVVAVNPDPDAGRVNPQDPREVQGWLGAAVGGGAEAVTWLDGAAPSQALARRDEESPWSLPLLIVALALALAELLMARFFSHAMVEPAGASGAAPVHAGSGGAGAEVTA